MELGGECSTRKPHASLQVEEPAKQKSHARTHPQLVRIEARLRLLLLWLLLATATAARPIPPALPAAVAVPRRVASVPAAALRWLVNVPSR